MIMRMGMIMRIITTTATIIATATIMSGRRKNLPLVKGRVSRKQSPRVQIPGGRGRPSKARAGKGESPDSTAALYRLMAWLSPSFPVGAFSYSSGIEWAVEAGDINDAATLADWLSLMMSD